MKNNSEHTELNCCCIHLRCVSINVILKLIHFSYSIRKVKHILTHFSLTDILSCGCCDPVIQLPSAFYFVHLASKSPFVVTMSASVPAGKLWLNNHSNVVASSMFQQMNTFFLLLTAAVFDHQVVLFWSFFILYYPLSQCWCINFLLLVYLLLCLNFFFVICRFSVTRLYKLLIDNDWWWKSARPDQEQEKMSTKHETSHGDLMEKRLTWTTQPCQRTCTPLLP